MKELIGAGMLYLMFYIVRECLVEFDAFSGWMKFHRFMQRKIYPGAVLEAFAFHFAGTAVT